MENNENEMNYQKLIYEESLKQTALLEKQAKTSKIQTATVSVLMLILPCRGFYAEEIFW